MTPLEHHASRPRGPRLRWVRLVVTGCCCAAAALAVRVDAAPSISQVPTGFIAKTPSDTTFSRRSDLRLEIDSRWANNYGYRPIRVRAEAAQPASTEKSITIRLHSVDTDWSSVNVTQSFDLPGGASAAETIVRCPQFATNRHCWWEVWVDGVRDKDLSLDESSSWNCSAQSNPNASDSLLKFLVVGPPKKSQQLLGSTTELVEALSLSESDLPTQWLDYSAFDVVALSPQDLEHLAGTRPEVVTALRRWMRTGGQLWVHSVGQRLEQLPTVERLLGLPTLAGAVDAKGGAVPRASGWKPLDLETHPDEPRVLRNTLRRSARDW